MVEASHGTSQVSRQVQVQVYACLKYQFCLFQNLPHSHRLLTPPYGGSSSFVKIKITKSPLPKDDPCRSLSHLVAQFSNSRD